RNHDFLFLLKVFHCERSKCSEMFLQYSVFLQARLNPGGEIWGREASPPFSPFIHWISPRQYVGGEIYPTPTYWRNSPFYRGFSDFFCDNSMGIRKNVP